MSKAHLSPELLALLQLSAPNTSEIEFEAHLRSIPASFNWNYFLERAIASNLAGYLLPYPEIAEKHYPTQIYPKIKSYQQRILLHSTLLREAILALAPQLDAALISYALLKGWDLHFRHGVSLKQRQISDIDILVAEKDLDKLENLLKANGFQTKRHVYKSRWHEKWLPTHAPLFARKGKIMIDVHTSAFSSEHSISWELNLSQIETFQIQDTSLSLLNQSQSELFLVLHTLKHFDSLHPLKAAQILDLWTIDLKLFGLPKDLKSKLKEFSFFINRVKKPALDTKEKYDQFFVHNLGGNSLSLQLRLLRLLKRLRPKNGFSKSIILTFFDLLPTKEYLESRFGKGNYWLLNLKRFQKSTH